MSTAPFMGGFGGRKPLPTDPMSSYLRPPGMGMPSAGSGQVGFDPWFAFGRQMKSPTQRNTRASNTTMRPNRSADPLNQNGGYALPPMPVMGMYGMGGGRGRL